jgi:hypothetical protein
MIATGELKYRDSKELFKYFLRALRDDEAPAVMLRWHAKVPGSDRNQQELVDDIMYSAFISRSSNTDDLTRCTAMPDAVRPVLEQIPAAKTSRTYLCQCLRVDGLPPRARAAAVELLFKYGDESCNSIKPEEWPGGSYDEKQPAYRNSRTGTPFYPNSRPLKDAVEDCLKQHFALKRAPTATTVTATLAGNRLSNVSAETKLYGEINDFERREGRGYLTASELHAMNKAASGCIGRLFDGFEMPERGDKKRSRIWFQLWDSSLAGNGYEE